MPRNVDYYHLNFLKQVAKISHCYYHCIDPDEQMSLSLVHAYRLNCKVSAWGACYCKFNPWRGLTSFVACCLPKKLVRNQPEVCWARNYPITTLFHWKVGELNLGHQDCRQTFYCWANRHAHCPKLKGNYLLSWAMTILTKVAKKAHHHYYDK